jgi:hypothetical protein
MKSKEESDELCKVLGSIFNAAAAHAQKNSRETAQIQNTRS